MALQFYFMNQTQEDVLSELSQLSHSINRTTRKILVKEIAPDKKQIAARLKKSQKDFDKKHLRMLKILNELDTLKLETDVDIQKLTKFNWTGTVNIDTEVEEIEVLTPPLLPESPDSFIVRTRLGDADAGHSTFEINLPDLSVPDAPRLLQYQYSSASVEEALKDVYRRNLLFTLAVFIPALLLIVFLTRRFLKPIENLKNSFEHVVDGDLDVHVQAGQSDEIGSLTRSFNLMVGELRKNKEKEQLLQRKERLASLGQLAAGVAHEIKNPLNAINLTISHLNDKFIPQDNQAATRYIRTVQTEIQRLDKLVNNFLSYLRSEDLKKEKTNLTLMWRELIQLYGRELEAANIEVLDEQSDAFCIDVDAERLKTAFGNVLVNAIQAMPEGGKLHLTSDTGSGELRLTDSGVGIDARNLDHIFDLFYTTKTNGSGLGLATAYKIIREHGADLVVESVPGKGTTVIFKWDPTCIS